MQRVMSAEAPTVIGAPGIVLKASLALRSVSQACSISLYFVF